MRWIFAGLMVAGLAAPATADTCFTRTYSGAHLKKNPNQTVRQMAVRFSEQGDESYASVRVLFRDTDAVFTQGLICWQPDPATYGKAFIGCSVECDGGSFTARRRGDDAILIETENGFLVSGDCGEGEELLRWVKDDGADRTVYKLYETEVSKCPAE